MHGGAEEHRSRAGARERLQAEARHLPLQDNRADPSRVEAGGEDEAPEGVQRQVPREVRNEGQSVMITPNESKP